MKNFTRFALFALSAALFTSLSPALAEEAISVDVETADAELAALPIVTPFPVHTDLGFVIGSRMTYVTFTNQSPFHIPFFNAYCSGDLSTFFCQSNCFSLPAYSSCTVAVTFHARFRDGLRKGAIVNGNGGGAWAQATVWAIDARRRPY